MASKHRHIRLGEARVHAAALAAISWGVLLVFVALSPGYLTRFGQLKWTDFVHFYTLGDAALRADAAVLFDADALHARQVTLVPASAPDRYLPVYGPQTALLFAPFARLPYLVAGPAWAAVILATYVWATYVAWRSSRHVLPPFSTVVYLALASPALVQLVGHGQTTPFVLMAFVCGWLAAESKRPYVAGLALSLLAIKPQFGLVLALVALATGQAAMIAGGLLGLLIQFLATLSVFGPGAWTGYIAMLSGLSTQAESLEPAAWKMHSLATITRLLPSTAGTVVWAIASLVLVGATIMHWRRSSSWRLRFGVTVVASSLVNPHLTVYDVTVIVLPVLWIGGWLAERRPDETSYWQLVYWLCVSLLLPTGLFVGIQASTLLMLAIVHVTSVEMFRPAKITGVSAAQP